MLVLTRRENQSIMIGDSIVVTVLEIRGDQVRLGIRAPRDVPVHREEIYAELQRENRAAAASVSEDVGFLPKPKAAAERRPRPQPE